VIGFDPRNDRVFHIAALGGHGVTTSFAVGRLAAEMIFKRCNQQPNPFDPARLLQTRRGGALADATKQRGVLTPPSD
jgi:glycine/D-amino acid oxidase-like deaminating enzyme